MTLFLVGAGCFAGGLFVGLISVVLGIAVVSIGSPEEKKLEKK